MKNTPNPFRYIEGCLTNPSPRFRRAMDAYLKAVRCDAGREIARKQLASVACVDVVVEFTAWADAQAGM